MINGIANMCKRHIHYLILNEINSNSELLELLRQIKHEETILVIEDIDCACDAVKQRDIKNNNTDEIKSIANIINDKDDGINDKNKSLRIEIVTNKTDDRKNQSSKLTLSGILNALDGITNNPGRILIMTTNHKDILDQALCRPGRTDLKIKFELCDRKQIADLYENFFNMKPNLNDINMIEENEHSPAKIVSIFMQYRKKPEQALKNLVKNEMSSELIVI